MLRVNLSVPSSRVKQSWTFEDGTVTLSLNVGNKSTLHNIREEQRSRLRGGGSLESHLLAASLSLSLYQRGASRSSESTSEVKNL